MRTGEYDIRAPLILGGDDSEAEAFGAAVWLWMHSPMHRDAPLHTLPTLLLPIIKRQQYVLVSHQNQPVLFLSWAWMNQEAEARYLTQPAINMPESDWNSGDRLWFCDWIAPFGHTREMRNLIVRELFPHLCMRALYHRGEQRGKRVVNFKGAQISHQQAKQWRVNHPLAVGPSEIQ
ncbi:toxin-activating lysine-acyltransferase [Salmonella enterica subsp. enterica serovar Java]|nr:toxin-activating lysine-acyltransferase [Salmonella enterica subsp. enterica serovar Oranienburg]EBX2067327.1 toxin-activating lysine-acyltransferase [Salmonella enterica subsp. enterica serovar Java]EBY8947537.1 toxin-activating lysine-acyltransferase [Salmonella enterica subsp. enterica serovar Oranienburg]ECB7404024.1 toxin-activating lysine-acyltransferase [Salmonella enterica subsp. enterica serovar Java]